MLKENGKLLYVTCSIFEEENRDVIEKFKQDLGNVSELNINFPSNVAHIKNQILPSEIMMDYSMRFFKKINIIIIVLFHFTFTSDREYIYSIR